ncbi:hypothetical protein BGZ92_006333 [Podila epicladia]|nr:hypothetical protein BGZ92_006333 [Podila epicladia]
MLVEELKASSTLTILNLEDNSIGDDGELVLSEALKSKATQWTIPRDSGAQALSEALNINSTLSRLSLENNSIGDNGTPILE